LSARARQTKMKGFIACIQRSGSTFYKMPKCSQMGAVPTSTCVQNLRTYFQPWPRRFSSYILYEGHAQTGAESQVDAKNHSKVSIGGKFTIKALNRQYEKGTPLAMITAYDCITARLAEKSGINLILVGDSVGNVMLGYESTVPVTMDEMLSHSQAVTRSVQRPLVIGDMPFGSYLNIDTALHNAALLLKKGGCDAVKLEGGQRVAHIVEALTSAGIAVMGHIGLTPQSHVQLGGYAAQGKSASQAEQLLHDAKSLEQAGAFAIVLECVPAQLAEQATQYLKVPTIGIGAGKGCSGQVLVCTDMLGLNPSPPRFVKQYASIGQEITAAFSAYRSEVESGHFPAQQHQVKLSEKQNNELTKLFERMCTTSDAGSSSNDAASNMFPSSPVRRFIETTVSAIIGIVAALIAGPRLIFAKGARGGEGRIGISPS